MEASPWTKEGRSRIQQTLVLRTRWTSRAKSTHSRNGQHLLDQGLGLPHCRGQPLWVRQAWPEADPHQTFFKNHKKDSHSESRAEQLEKLGWWTGLSNSEFGILFSMPRLRKYWLLGQEHVWTDSWLIFHVAQQLVTGDASCLLMEAGFHPASCGLRPRPRKGFKGVLSSGCYGSLWGDHRAEVVMSLLSSLPSL